VLAPEVGALRASGDAGADWVPFAAELDFGLGIGFEVERPGRDLALPALVLIKTTLAPSAR